MLHRTISSNMHAKNKDNQVLVTNFNKLAIYFGSDRKLSFKLKALRKILPQIINHEFPIVSGEYAMTCLEGVGKGFANRIDEILETGRLKELKHGKEDESGEINELCRVTGIGAVYAKKLITEHNIHSVDQLRSAVDKGTIKLTHHRAIGLKYFEDFEKRIPASEVMLADKLLHKMCKKIDKKLILTVCGSYRRGCETCGDIDVLITHPDAENEGTYLTELITQLSAIGFLVDHLTHQGNKKYMGVCKVGDLGRRIDIRFVDHASYYAAMIYFTGSKNFNIRIRKQALEMGYSLNEYGLHCVDDVEKAIIPVNSEEELFEMLGMEYVDPTDRDE